MATTTGAGAVNNQGAFVYTWTGITPGNVGNGVDISAFGGPKASIQVEGTLGTSPSYSIEGSNDGSNWETLNDINGTALSTKSTKGLYSIAGPCRYVRPNLASGTGSSLNFTLVVYPD